MVGRFSHTRDLFGDSLDRTDEMNARYTNNDNDPEGDWASDNPSGPGASSHKKMVYAIQSPFTGELHYPPSGACWRSDKKDMKAWLQAWGSTYEEKWIDDEIEKQLAQQKREKEQQKENIKSQIERLKTQLNNL